MKDVLLELFLAGQPVIVWVAVALLAFLTRLVVGKIKNETAGAIVGRALDEIGDAVASVYQTYVSALKDASADGKLTDEEKAEAKRLAIAEAVSNLGAKGLARLARVLGISSLEKWFSTKTEASLVRLKAAGVPSPKP